MKRSILFLLSTILSCSLFAQSDERKENGHEIGINATSFVKEFLSLNTSDVDEGLYMLSYKKHNHGKAIRAGIGGRFSQVTEDLDGGGKLTTNDNFLALRIGYEWNKAISNRWNTFFGADAITDFSQTQSFTSNFLNTGQVEETTIKTQTNSFGGGPILGIQFFISNNISIMTESSLYFKYSAENKKETFKINTESNTNKDTFSNELDFGLPTAIYFVVRF